MFVFTKKQMKQLVKNGRSENEGKDHMPVLKLVLRRENSIWLLTEIRPEDYGIAYGLEKFCDDTPEMAEFYLGEICCIGAKVDHSFKAKYPISVYRKAAEHYGTIVDDVELLKKFAE